MGENVKKSDMLKRKEIIDNVFNLQNEQILEGF